MKTPFTQAVRHSLKFRFTIFLICLCSVLVAFFWGANITAVHPFVEAVFRGESMHEWVDHQIYAIGQNVDELEARAARLNEQRRDASPDKRGGLDL